MACIDLRSKAYRVPAVAADYETHQRRWLGQRGGHTYHPLTRQIVDRRASDVASLARAARPPSDCQPAGSGCAGKREPPLARWRRMRPAGAFRSIFIDFAGLVGCPKRRWDAIDFAHGQMHVSRAKNGAPSVHPLSGVELRALRRRKRGQEPPSPFVFTSERGAPFTTAGWRKMVARLGVAAKPGWQAESRRRAGTCASQAGGGPGVHL